jgi:hypothetical protein
MYSKNIKCRNSISKWYDAWIQKGIDMTSIGDTDITHYDISVLLMLQKYGKDYFSRQDIWRADWDRIISLAIKYKIISKDFNLARTKRSFIDRLFHLYMRMTIDCRYVNLIERKMFRKGFSY